MGDLVKNYDFIGISKAFDTKAFGEALEAGSAAGGRQNKFIKKTSFAPSGLGYGCGTCPRYWYYAFHGAEFNYETTARQRANMEAGTEAGKRIARVVDDAGILVSAEAEVRWDDPPIFGFMDLMVNWQGEEMVGEVKTTKQESWNYRQAQMKAPGYQLIQLLTYMKILKRDKGFFLIENKNTHELLVIPIKMTEHNKEFIDGVFDWMRTVKENSDNDLLPHRPFNPKSLECKSCPVWETCWSGYTRQTAKNKGSDPAFGMVEVPPLKVPK